MTNEQLKYPLLPFSQLVYDMTCWKSMASISYVLHLIQGRSRRKQIVDAFYIACANHPVFQMQVARRGMHYAKPLKDFLHGRYHKVTIFEENEDLIIEIHYNRILGDGKSMDILMDDIRRAYEGLSLESDDYWGYVAQYEQSKASPHYKDSQEWLIKEFADESVPVRPTIDRRWLSTILPPKV